MQLEIDPLLVSLVLSFLVTVRMASQEKDLSGNTTKNAGILAMLWVFCLLLLYLTAICVATNRYCQLAVDMRKDFVVNYIGTGLLNYLSTVSLLVGSTIRLSGTSSKSWKNLSYSLFVLFVAALIMRFVLAPILSVH